MSRPTGPGAQVEVRYTATILDTGSDEFSIVGDSLWVIDGDGVIRSAPAESIRTPSETT